ncbi:MULTISPECIES: hypothetical protein [Methylobacterium]|uniref:hypothetical protein n=1 Tax=Methylobacterium TaxID=407 RepID=UPI002F35E89C
MTLDTQPDRFVASLASVSDQTQSEHLEPSLDKTYESDEATSEKPTPVAKPTNAFEGFGSFSG